MSASGEIPEVEVGGLDGVGGEHVVHEDYSWDQNIVDHPPRKESPEYAASRRQMQALVGKTDPALLLYGAAPGGWQDHHGGGLWAFTGDDPDGGHAFHVLLPVGIEWAAQFACDPGKVDRLRQVAAAFYSGFPRSLAALGLTEIVSTPIIDQAGIEAWIDSLCNASVPMRQGAHTGSLQGAHPYAGYHHYPKPVADVQFVVRDDFALWVGTPDGPVAVVPTAAVGDPDRRVTLIWCPPSHPLAAAMWKAQSHGARLALPSDHPVTLAAYSKQSEPSGLAAPVDEEPV